MNEAIAVAQKAIQMREEAERDIAIANEQQSKLIQLLPKAFQAGKRTLSKAGVTARHQENRALKQDVFTWLDANPPKHRGKDAAATAIAGGVVPVVSHCAQVDRRMGKSTLHRHGVVYPACCNSCRYNGHRTGIQASNTNRQKPNFHPSKHRQPMP